MCAFLKLLSVLILRSFLKNSVWPDPIDLSPESPTHFFAVSSFQFLFAFSAFIWPCKSTDSSKKLLVASRLTFFFLEWHTVGKTALNCSLFTEDQRCNIDNTQMYNRILRHGFSTRSDIYYDKIKQWG